MTGRFVNFYHFDEVVSTMDEAERFINNGVRRGIVLADSQTGGCGRNGKKWFSPDNGNIYISFFEKIDDQFSLDLVPHRTALSVFNTVSSFVKDGSVKIKWPNDILIDMKKVSGVISRSVRKGKERFYICGIGINIYFPDIPGFESEWETGSIREKNDQVTTEILLSKLISETDSIFEMDDREVIAQYVSLVSWMSGRSIRFTQDGTTFYEGNVLGFNENGSMIKILSHNGEVELSTVSIASIW